MSCFSNKSHDHPSRSRYTVSDPIVISYLLFVYGSRDCPTSAKIEKLQCCSDEINASVELKHTESKTLYDPKPMSHKILSSRPLVLLGIISPHIHFRVATPNKRFTISGRVRCLCPCIGHSLIVLVAAFLRWRNTAPQGWPGQISSAISLASCNFFRASSQTITFPLSTYMSLA